MISAEVDRRVELAANYEACQSTTTTLKIATELRLTEQAIARLYRQVSTDVPAPMSVTSQKAQRAANARWNRVAVVGFRSATVSGHERRGLHSDDIMLGGSVAAPHQNSPG